MRRCVAALSLIDRPYRLVVAAPEVQQFRRSAAVVLLRTVPAMFKRRAIARLIDTFVLAAAVIALGVPLGFGVAWLLTGAALTVVFLAGTTAAWGTTLGKGLTGLRVISATTDRRPTLRQAVRREALNAVGAVPIVGPIVFAAFWMTVAVTARRSPAGDGFNDRLAPHTRVVHNG
jgi:uncharacterized RDD family membrane protein YckC